MRTMVYFALEDDGSLARRRSASFFLDALSDNRARSFERRVAACYPLLFRFCDVAVEGLFVEGCVGGGIEFDKVLSFCSSIGKVFR